MSVDQVRRVTSYPGPGSDQLAERRRRAVPRGIGATMPVFANRARDGVLVDVDGNSFIDLASGIAVTSVGSTAPRVVSAIQEQAAAFTHTCFLVTPYESYVQVAEALNELTPGSHEKKTALFSTGSEAMENAVKIARSFTRRNAVVVFDHAYHGRTNLTMAMTAKSAPYKAGFGPFAPEVYRVPTSYPFRDDGVDGPTAARRAISAIEKHVGANEAAAVVIEPIQGEGGFIVPAPDFLPTLAAWCRANGVVFIVDEVQTGFARTGDLFASEHENLVPDIVVSAKGIAGGLPLAAVTGRADIMDAPDPGGLGGTYGGNPLACAAALAVLRTIEEDDLLDRAGVIEGIMKARLLAIQTAEPRIGDIRGRGAMIAIELVDPVSHDPDPRLAQRVAEACRANGVIVLVCGTFGNVIRFLPPLTISPELLTEGLDVLAAAFERSDAP